MRQLLAGMSPRLSVKSGAAGFARGAPHISIENLEEGGAGNHEAI